MTAKTFVLFDLDGTLTESGPGIIASYRHTLAAFGLEASDDELRRCVGPPMLANMASLGIPAELMDKAVATYREYFTSKGMFDNALYPGTVDMLGDLASAGLRLAVATSKLEEHAVQIIEHFGITRYFEQISGATRDSSRVAKVDVVLDALVNLGSPSVEEGALVGDREHDMFAARELGLGAVGALWGYGDEPELIAAGAQQLAPDPASAAALLLGRRS